MKNPHEGFPLAFVNASLTLGRYVSTRTDAGLISKIIPLSEYPRVLDVCCGFGRFTKELGLLGYNVTGVDLSLEQIEAARLADPGGTYIQGDMRETPQLDFDAIINMYTSFGYFDSEEDDLLALCSWYRSLRPGGVLVMELADMDRARAKLARDEDLIYRETGDVTEEIRMDWQNRILEVTYLQHDSNFRCYTRLYEKEKLSDYLRSVGFSSVFTYGSLRLEPKNAEDNLILIARK